MRLGTCLLPEGLTLQGAHHKLAGFCSALVAGYYAAVDRETDTDHAVKSWTTARPEKSFAISTRPSLSRVVGVQPSNR